MPAAGRPFVTDVLVNDRPAARWELEDGDLQVLRAEIPAELVEDGAPIRVTFLAPALVPLTEAGGTRLVGLGIAAASLAPLDLVRDAARYASVTGRAAQAVELGRAYDLLGADAGRVFLAGRWIANAAWGMFCAERRPRLEMLLPSEVAGDLRLTLRLRPVATAAVPLDLRLLAHGDQIASWHFASDAPATLSVTLPAALVARAALLPLELVAGEPRAPAALGLGIAAESVGFGLIGFALEVSGEAPRAPGCDWRRTRHSASHPASRRPRKARCVRRSAPSGMRGNPARPGASGMKRCCRCGSIPRRMVQSC